ncbi:MAG: hypothetical protein EXS00_06090 [Phycisphaerales bacterium]|nr:hypothetical protein [Phycisphaerales bacterium]
MSTKVDALAALRCRAFTWVASFACTKPWVVIGISALAGLSGALLAAKHLTLDANTDSLIGLERPFMKEYRQFLHEFGDLEYLYIAVDAHGDDELAQRAVDELGKGLGRIDELPQVHWSITPDEQLRFATRAMPLPQLQGLAESAGACVELVRQGNDGEAAQLERILISASEKVDRLLSVGSSLPAVEQRQLGADAMLLLQVVGSDFGAGSASAGFRNRSWDASDASAPIFTLPAPEYLRSRTGKIWFIEILPQKDFSSLEVIAAPLARIRALMTEVEESLDPPTTSSAGSFIASSPPSGRQLEIGLTGKPVLQADELSTSSRDMTRGSIIATLIIAGLFMWALRGVREPLLAVLAFVAAFAWTYGAATILVGRLTLLSTVFMLVLVGAGLDYGVHVIARFAELRRRMLWTEAVREAVIRAGPPTWTGAATSAVVFFLALLTDFGGLRELGVIAGVGLLLCALAMTVTLPALLVAFPRRARGSTANSTVSDPISIADELAMTELRVHPLPVGSAFTRHARLLLIAAGLSAALAAVAAGAWLHFEQNLLKLQADSLDSVEWERRIFADSASASWFAASICPDEASAVRTVAAAQNHPDIGSISSVFDLCEPSSPERDAARAQFSAPVLAQCNMTESTSMIAGAEELGAPNSQSDDSAPPSATSVNAAAKRAAGAANRLALAARLSASEGEAAQIGAVAKQLEYLAAGLESDFEQSRALATKSINRARHALVQMAQGDSDSLRAALPAALRAKMVSPQGQFLVALHPREDVWEMEPMERFVAAARSIDNHVTGVPITQFESLLDMRGAFLLMSLGSLLIVAVLVWIDFRNIAATAACIGVVMVGLLWTLGIMAIAGITLNLANFFGIPMLIGLGIDSSVHVLHRARESGSAHSLGWTRRAVILTAATTAIGFGTLIMADHRGLRSLGWIIAIGSMAILGATIWILPPLLDACPRMLREREVIR